MANMTDAAGPTQAGLIFPNFNYCRRGPRWILIWGRVIDPIATKFLLYLATLNKFVGNEPYVGFKRVMIDLYFPAEHVLDK